MKLLIESNIGLESDLLCCIRLYSSLLSSREIGFRCMKLQKPPLVHSLKMKRKPKQVSFNTTANKTWKQRDETGIKKRLMMLSRRAAAVGLPHLVLSTAGLTKVSDRREFSVNWTTIKPPVVQLFHSLFCISLVSELHRTPTSKVSFTPFLRKTYESTANSDGKSYNFQVLPVTLLQICNFLFRREIAKISLETLKSRLTFT